MPVPSRERCALYLADIQGCRFQPPSYDPDRRPSLARDRRNISPITNLRFKCDIKEKGQPVPSNYAELQRKCTEWTPNNGSGTINSRFRYGLR